MNTINDVIITSLPPISDHRGWLSELYRSDETSPDILPTMAYLSCTKPGIARGPHEHLTQTDTFIFITGTWFVKLWDNRPKSKTFLNIMRFKISRPTKIIVPPGIIHAYANANALSTGLVLNMPNVLYKGIHKELPPDEIRHETNIAYSITNIQYQHPIAKLLHYLRLCNFTLH